MPGSPDASFRFDRFETVGLTSLAPLLRGRGGGIYVLEFANGEQYVGQTVDFVHRMSAHVRGGGRHHAPWGDVVAVSIMNVPSDEMNRWERRVIAERRAAGVRLRNNAFNFGFEGPSALDAAIPVVQQEHWATGGGSFDLEQYVEAAARPAGPEPRLFRGRAARELREVPGEEPMSGADLVVTALALIVAQVIPDAPRLEGRYWTLSDYPNTVGGRYATLNVGTVELVFFPRWCWRDYRIDGVFLNLPAGTVREATSRAPMDPDCEGPVRAVTPSGVPVDAQPGRYGLCETDLISGYLVDLLTDDWGIADALREMAIQLMRSSDSGKFAASHSPELTRRVYARIGELADQGLL